MLAIALAVWVAPADALETKEKKLGWTDSAELSFVVTGGNAETAAFGFKNKLTRTWESARFQLNAGGIRVETTMRQRAVDSSANPLEANSPEPTAEKYSLSGLYDHNITLQMFWQVGAGWDRNRFAGIKNRYTYVSGLGNSWISTKKLNWRTTYAATFTDQEDEDPVEAVDNTFFGVRLTSDLKVKIGDNSSYENILIADFNLDETEDWRGDWIHSVSVSMSSILALKVSLQLLYDNMPSFEEVDVVTGQFPPGTPATTPPFTASIELDELDTIFTTSLVINF